MPRGTIVNVTRNVHWASAYKDSGRGSTYNNSWRPSHISANDGANHYHSARRFTRFS